MSQSQSIRRALHLHHRSSSGTPAGRGETSKPLFVCERGGDGAVFAPKEGCPCARFTQVRSVCAPRMLVCVFCMRLCVFSVVFSSSTAIPLSAVCPSLKHQLVSEGPLGGKETTGRLHSSFHPHKDVPLLPVLSFFQEVLAGRGFFFFHSVSLSRSLVADNVDDLPLSYTISSGDFFFLLLPAENVFVESVFLVFFRRVLRFIDALKIRGCFLPD